MKIVVTGNYEELSKKAADILGEEIRSNPKTVLGLATGSTPIGTYRQLVKMHKEDGLDFSRITSFNLDEYLGLDPENQNSYKCFMKDHLFKHVNIKMERAYVPDGMVEDPAHYGEKYDKMIEDAGGIRIQILGIGSNGHIAFNEPAEFLSVGTGVVELTRQTISDNARFFESEDQVPTRAITMGMGSIMKASKILLLASGLSKAPIIKKLLEGGTVSTMIPASFLLLHPDVILICDQEAYSLVEK